jgi:hypothetical protein
MTKFAITPHIPTTQENSHVEITNEDNAFFLPSISGLMFTWSSFYTTKQSTKLVTSMWKYWSAYMRLCVEKKPWSLAQRLDSPPWHCSRLHGVLCQALSGQKFDYWNRTSISFPWFGSVWLLVVSVNKICLKRDETFRILKTFTALKAVPQQEFQKYFKQWQHR